MATRYLPSLADSIKALSDSNRAWVLITGTPCEGFLYADGSTEIAYHALGADVNEAVRNLAGYLEWMKQVGGGVL